MTVAPAASPTVTVEIVAGLWRDKSLYGGYVVLTRGDGTRSHDNGGATATTARSCQRTYFLKLSVLKALGDASTTADWETFTHSADHARAPVGSKQREAPRSRGLSHVLP